MNSQDWLAFWLENHEEIYTNLRQKESLRPVLPLNCDSKPKFRLVLIEMLEYLCNTLWLSDNVLHLSLNLVDYLLVPFDELKKVPFIMILLTSLRLSAKVSDSDDHVPRFADLNELCANLGTAQDYNELERRILYRFNWKISFPTVATFLNCFRPFIFLPDESQANLKMMNKYGTPEILASLMGEEVNKIALLVFQEREAYDFAPSLIAAACIAVIRQAFQITPIWSFQLHRVTKYSFGDMRQVNRLLRRLDSSQVQRSLTKSFPRLNASQSSAELPICA